MCQIRVVPYRHFANRIQPLTDSNLIHNILQKYKLDNQHQFKQDVFKSRLRNAKMDALRFSCDKFCRNLAIPNSSIKRVEIFCEGSITQIQMACLPEQKSLLTYQSQKVEFIRIFYDDDIELVLFSTSKNRKLIPKLKRVKLHLNLNDFLVELKRNTGTQYFRYIEIEYDESGKISSSKLHAKVKC